MFFDIIGKVDTEMLLLAINRTFTAFEATMSKIVLLDDGEAYYDTMPISGCTANITQLDWYSLIRENEKSPFLLETGELMRVFVKPLDCKTEVFIMAHHLVGDGKSIVYFIESMMKEFIGETCVFQPLHLITEDTFAKESCLQWWIKWWVSSSNRRWKKNGQVFHFTDYYKLQKAYWENRKSVILIENLLPEQVKIIHKKATNAGVSMNSYIITAILKVNKNLNSIGLAVNARIDNNRTMSNQVTGIAINYSYNEKLSFEKNAQEVHRRIYKKLNHPVNKYSILRVMSLFQSSLIDSIMMHTYGLYHNKVTENLAKILGYTSDSNNSFGITNLTKLDIDNTYNECRIENLYFIPPVVSYCSQVVGIATTESGMTVTCHCMSDTYNENIKLLFEDTMKVLCLGDNSCKII